MDSGSCVREMCFGCDNRAKQHIYIYIYTYILPWRDCATAPHPAMVSPSAKRVPRQCKQPNLENHCLFRALWSESWEDADTLLWQQASRLTDMRERMPVQL